MLTLVAVFSVLLLSVAAMSVGFWLKGRSLRPSCGGLTDCMCRLEGINPQDCPRDKLVTRIGRSTVKRETNHGA